MILKSVSLAFQTVIDCEEELIRPYLTVNQPRFDPEAIPARKRYLNRRVKLVQTLLRWRKHFGKCAVAEGLVKRAVDGMIVPVADGGWEVGGEECLRKVRLGVSTVGLGTNLPPSQVFDLLPPELVTSSLRSRLSR